MQRTAVVVRPRRDGATLAVGYLILAAIAIAIGVWGTADRAARPSDGRGVVWITWFVLAAWLLAAVVAAWGSRQGRLAPWLAIAGGLGALWLVAVLVVAGSGPTSVSWYVVPAVAFGATAAITLGLVVRVARVAGRG